MRSKRAVRAAIVAILAIAGAMVLQGRAGADSASPSLEQQAWFWSSNQDITGCYGANCIYGNITQGPLYGDGGVTSPISPGHLGIAMKNGVSDMRAYLQFDFSAIPVGSTVEKFIVTLTTSRPNDNAHVEEHTQAQGQPPATSGPNAAAVDACVMAQPWGPAEGDPPFSKNIDPTTGKETDTPNEPTGIKCDLAKTEGKEAADGKSWTFDLTPMAQLWLSPDGSFFNNGVALLPSEGGAHDTWTLELHGAALTSSDKRVYVTQAEAVKTFIKYTPAAPVIITPPPPAPVTPPVSSGGDKNISFGNTPTNPAPSTPPVAPVATTAPKRPGTPGYVWAVIPLALIGMVGLSRAVGADEDAETMTNRVATALRRRRESQEESPPS